LGYFWNQLKGWKLQLEVNATRHLSFTDFPVLAKLLGVDPGAIPEVEQLIGTIDGLRVLEILKAYVGGFLSYVLKGQSAKVLQGPSKAFPEVTFQNSSGVKY